MQVDVFEPGSSAASCLMPVRPAHPRSERHVFQHGQMTEQQVILKYNTGGSPLGRNEYATCRIVESLTVKLDVPVRYAQQTDRKSTRLNSSHVAISYAVLCLKNTTTQPGQGQAAAHAAGK